MKERLNAADLYDAVYHRLRGTTLFRDVLSDVLGRDRLGSGDQFSFVKREEVDEIVDMTRRLGRSFRGLDVGCGLGGLTTELARRCGGAWVGLDISRVAIETARRRARASRRRKKPSFVVGSVQELPFSEGELDCIIAIDSLQHAVPYPQGARELGRVLRPRGLLVFTNWMRALPLDLLVARDPLLAALVENGFEIHSTRDTDPGFEKQLSVYAALVARFVAASPSRRCCEVDPTRAKSWHHSSMPAAKIVAKPRRSRSCRARRGARIATLGAAQR